MATAHKKVLVRRFTGDVLAGYLAVSGFIRREQQQLLFLDLLDLSGRILPLPLDSVKMVSYVRDFNLADVSNPERLGRRSFLARPRAEGLWLRLTFLEGDTLEGLAAADISFVMNAMSDHGVCLTPPDIRSNTQRVFVPGLAISELQVLAVITSPTRKKVLGPFGSDPVQNTLFSAVSED